MDTILDYIKKIFAFFANIMKRLNIRKYWFPPVPVKILKDITDLNLALTEGFSPDELSEFYGVLGTKKIIPEGEVIFHENDVSDSFYIILNGEAEVYVEKSNELHGGVHTHMLAILKKDDVIGDMALIENMPRSASLRAKTELSVLQFNLEEVNAHPQIRLILTKNMAKHLSEKLRYTNQVTVKKMEENLEQAQARNVLGVFMVAMFWLISLYTISLTTLISVEKHLSNSTFLSVGLIVFFAVGIVGAMRLTGLPLKSFGIESKNWFKKSYQAFFYSIPIMIVFLLIKAYMVYFGPNPHHIALFNGFDEGIVDGQFSWVFYLTVVSLYAVLSPIQELVARCALQSTFFSFLPGKKTFRTWNAILLSNLIFSSVHSHLSVTFAILTFIPGLFWGWLFHKQHSFIGVSVSHVLLGVWGVFIIGAKGIIY